MAIEIVDFPIKHGGSFHSYGSLPEGRYLISIMEYKEWIDTGWWLTYPSEK